MWLYGVKDTSGIGLEGIPYEWFRGTALGLQENELWPHGLCLGAPDEGGRAC